MNDSERITELQRLLIVQTAYFQSLVAAIEKTNPEIDTLYKKFTKDLEHRLGKPGFNQEN